MRKAQFDEQTAQDKRLIRVTGHKKAAAAVAENASQSSLLPLYNKGLCTSTLLKTSFAVDGTRAFCAAIALLLIAMQ